MPLFKNEITVIAVIIDGSPYKMLFSKCTKESWKKESWSY